MKKTAVIKEENLRFFVREQIRQETEKKKLREGAIKVSQGVALENVKSMTIDKCEIKLPKEFKELFNKIRDGRHDRVKMILYKRAMRLGVDMDDLKDEAAEEMGVMGDLPAPIGRAADYIFPDSGFGLGEYYREVK